MTDLEHTDQNSISSTGPSSPLVGISLTGILGGYDWEFQESECWRWTADRLEYRYTRPEGSAIRARVRFLCSPSSAPRELKLSAMSASHCQSQTFSLREGWNELISDWFEFTELQLTLLFECLQAPLQLTAEDRRMLAFRLKSVELEVFSPGTRIPETLSDKLVCPVCLHSLAVGESSTSLLCAQCGGVFPVYSGLPVLLVDDEHRRIKVDEIKGEQEFNTKVVPPEVHLQRNAFVDRNTELFLAEAGVSLRGQEVLTVGCSMAELLLCARHGASPVCLEIVPALAYACQQATIRAGVTASWLSGDGECLPFRTECFDVVVIRQALHHMLKYYSAIAEFFRVLRLGGSLIIVDEPFCALDPADHLLLGPSDLQLYEGISIADLRASLGMNRVQVPQRAAADLKTLEKTREYRAWDGSDPESLLADKYHSFSLLNCLAAITMHTDTYRLFWPREVGWADNSGDVVRFCHGPSPHYALPMVKRIVSQGNVSIIAKKLSKTVLHRDRQTVCAMPLDVVQSML